MHVKTKKRFVSGLVLLLALTAIVHTGAYYSIRNVKSVGQAYLHTEMPVNENNKGDFEFFLSLVLSLVVIGGLSFVIGEREIRHEMLAAEKKMKDLDELSVLRLAHYAQKEIHRGLHHELVHFKLRKEGWHPNTIHRVLSHTTVGNNTRVKK